MIEMERIVRDKSVALVGSAASLQKLGCAQQIDSHDVVIRMNLSIPGPQRPERVGNKTTIWTMGRSFPGYETPEGTERIIFMKLTAAGDREWPVVQQRKVPACRWPHQYEDEVLEFVGASPGTGIRMLWWLKKVARPASVNIFGMDCWRTPSCWSGAPAPAHDPELEFKALRTLTQ